MHYIERNPAERLKIQFPSHGNLPSHGICDGGGIGAFDQGRREVASQPALSAQIRALEEELGLALFTRSPARMIFTRAGQRLLKQVHKLLADVQQLGDLGQGAC